MIWLLFLVPATAAQFTSQTYPDPRIDPLSCRLAFPSPVCDPSAVVTDDERTQLVRKLQTVGIAPFRDEQPLVESCDRQYQEHFPGLRSPARKEPRGQPFHLFHLKVSLQITVAIIDKIGNIPGSPVDIEKFANNLKRRFQNFQVSWRFLTDSTWRNRYKSDFFRMLGLATRMFSL